jgi:hypothetical protein
MSWLYPWYSGRSYARGLAFLIIIIALLLNTYREEIFILIIIALILVGIFLIVKHKSESQSKNTNEAGQKQQTMYINPLNDLLGRRNIVIEAEVEGFTDRDRPNRPDKLFLNWGGKRTALNIWNKQPNFYMEVGKKYIFNNISCSKNKIDGRPTLNYDVNYYYSFYVKLRDTEDEKKRYENSSRQSEKSSKTHLDNLLNEFGPFNHIPTLDELNQRKRYWNQILHPDFNIDKPEKLRKKMEDELKRKNQIYDEILKETKK